MLTMTILSDEEIVHYRTHGFVVLRQVVPEIAFELAQKLSEDMVDDFICIWNEKGLITSEYRELDFWQRLLVAWRAAGQPHFRRNPFRRLIKPELFSLLKLPTFLSIACQILSSEEISVHGSYNARPQIPNFADTITPPHQDSQYWHLDFGSVEPDHARKTPVVTMWFPFQAVDATSGSLQVISRQQTGDKVFAPHSYDFERTGFFGLHPDELKQYTLEPLTLERGDMLLLDQKTVHGTCPMTPDRLRWSLDFRYESTLATTALGRKYGFVAQSKSNPETETQLADWLALRQT